MVWRYSSPMSAAPRTYPVPTAGTVVPVTVTQWQRNTGANPIGYASAAKLAALALERQPRVCTHKRMGRPRETTGVAEIAGAYNEALAGGKPAQAVRERFPWYDSRTIGRRIRLAREMGLITGPAPRGGRPRRAAGADAGLRDADLRNRDLMHAAGPQAEHRHAR